MDCTGVGIDSDGGFKDYLLATRNVEPAFAVIGATPQRPDRVSRRAFRSSNYLVCQGINIVEPVAFHMQQKSVCANSSGRHLGSQVTEHRVGCAYIVSDDIEQ